MTGRTAWTRGFDVLFRHPWLALIPAAWDLLQLSLAWLGLPLYPIADAARLLDKGLQLGAPPQGNISFTAFLPSALPSIANLKVAMQPVAQAAPVGAPAWVLLIATLLLPLLDGFLTALFLSLLAEKVCGREVTARSALTTALQRTPALAALLLALRVGQMLLPAPFLIAGMIAAMLIWPLLPYALGAAGHSLFDGLMGAPRNLVDRLGDWFSLGIRAALADGLFMLIWSAMGRPAGLALAIYPLLATALVAGATALYTQAPEEIAPEAPRSSFWLWTLPLMAGGALAGWALLQSWAGWYPGPLAAIAARDMPPGQYTAPEAYALRFSMPEPGKETRLVIWQGGVNSRNGLSRLQPGRFGWKLLDQDISFPFPDPRTPAEVRFAQFGGQHIYWGEIYDSRVAYLQIGDARFPVGQHGPLFILTDIPEGSQIYMGKVEVLDRDGNPVPPGRGRS